MATAQSVGEGRSQRRLIDAHSILEKALRHRIFGEAVV
jgi:hypothetical protein